MLRGSVVNNISTTSRRDLQSPESWFLSPLPGFLSTTVLGFLGASELLALISVARMKSAAFLIAFVRVVSFYSAKENLNRPLFKPFRKEVYVALSSKFGIRTAP